MNIDNLHDALGLLDDDLIEEVDVLRRKMKQHDKSFRWGTLAACLSVFLVSACAIGLLWNNGLGGEKKSASTDAATEEEIVGDSDEVSDDVCDMYTNENTSTDVGEAQKDIFEVKVEITSVQDNCFVGTIKESSDKKLCSVGADVTIIPPDKAEFSEGTVVVVQFTQQTNSEIVSDHDAESSEDVIYATSVTIDESE